MTTQRDAEHRQRVYDQLDDVAARVGRVETRQAVLESRLHRLDEIADAVGAIKDAVLGLPEHPDSGLVARMAAQEQLENAEHGAIKMIVVGTPILVGVMGFGLKVLGVF